MNCTEAQCQLQALVDHELDPTAAREVAAHVSACASCRAVLREKEQLAAALAEALVARAAAPGGVAAAVAERVAREPLAVARRRAPLTFRGRRLAWAGTAAALVAGAVVMLTMMRPHSDATARQAVAARAALPRGLVAVIAARGPVTDAAGHALQVGDRLEVGATVRTGPGGVVGLVTRRGSELGLNANSELTLAAKDAAKLGRGELYCRSREHEIKLVATAAGQIHLLGTAIDAATTNSHKVTVTVLDGKVRLSNGHGEALVAKGKRATMLAALPPGEGASTNTAATLAWYDSRTAVVSDFSEVAYNEYFRKSSALWAVKLDGSNRRLVRSFLCESYGQRWLPGQQRLLLSVLMNNDMGAWARAVDSRYRLINAVTGEEAPLSLPAPEVGGPLDGPEVSPDGTQVAYLRDPDPTIGNHYVVCVHNLVTGETKELLQFAGQPSLSWAPDGRRLAVTTIRKWTVVDVQTGAKTELAIEGGEARFSPDGARLAFAGYFVLPDNRGGQFRLGVLDLARGAQPRYLTGGDGPYLRYFEACGPAWSPDGARIAFVGYEYEGTTPLQFRVYTAQADGSGVKQVYQLPPGRTDVTTLSWAPSGDRIYLRCSQGREGDAVMTIRADGSGVVSDLSLTSRDATAPADVMDQLRAAAQVAQDTRRRLALGSEYEWANRAADSRAAFKGAAAVYASLAWRYPKARISTEDATYLANWAQKLAERSDAQIASTSCERRAQAVQLDLWYYAKAERRLPPSLEALAEWDARHSDQVPDGIKRRDPAGLRYQCPSGKALTYHAPSGALPEPGTVLLECTEHPESRVVWTQNDSDHMRLEWSRIDRDAARRQ